MIYGSAHAASATGWLGGVYQQEPKVMRDLSHAQQRLQPSAGASYYGYSVC